MLPIYISFFCNEIFKNPSKSTNLCRRTSAKGFQWIWLCGFGLCCFFFGSVYNDSNCRIQSRRVGIRRNARSAVVQKDNLLLRTEERNEERRKKKEEDEEEEDENEKRVLTHAGWLSDGALLDLHRKSYRRTGVVPIGHQSHWPILSLKLNYNFSLHKQSLLSMLNAPLMPPIIFQDILQSNLQSVFFHKIFWRMCVWATSSLNDMYGACDNIMIPPFFFMALLKISLGLLFLPLLNSDSYFYIV